MKKRFCLMVALVGALSLLGYGHAREPGPQAGISTPGKDFVLKVGYFEFPGVTYTDEAGVPAGLVNEITVKTLEQAQIPFAIQSYPAARFFRYLEQGKVHLFNGVSSIPVVARSTISSQINLFPLHMRVYWVGDKPAVTQKEDLIGHSVILVKGFTYKDWGEWIREPSNQVTFFDAYSHLDAFKMLKRERAEYLLNYRYIDANVLKKVDIPDMQTRTLFKWDCVFNLHKDTPNAEAILKKLEESYQTLVENGELKRYQG